MGWLKVAFVCSWNRNPRKYNILVSVISKHIPSFVHSPFKKLKSTSFNESKYCKLPRLNYFCRVRSKLAGVYLETDILCLANTNILYWRWALGKYKVYFTVGSTKQTYIQLSCCLHVLWCSGNLTVTLNRVKHGSQVLGYGFKFSALIYENV